MLCRLSLSYIHIAKDVRSVLQKAEVSQALQSCVRLCKHK
jgi:hypothetical protein